MLTFLGFIITSVLAGVVIFVKFVGDVIPLFGLKRRLNKLALSNWTTSIPQVLPIYSTAIPKSLEEVGILPQKKEWDLESPRKLDALGETEDMLIYGLDENGNVIIFELTRSWNGRTQAVIALRAGAAGGQNLSVKLEGDITSECEFSLGNLKFELVEPFRIWRIWYNGYMENNDDKAAPLVHVVVSFLWKPLEYAKDFRKDANVSLLSNTLGSQGLFGTQFSGLEKLIPNGYHQFGTLHGTIVLNNGSDETKEMYLYGFRSKRHLCLTDPNSPFCFQEFYAMKDNFGDAVRLIGSNEMWLDGEMLHPSLDINPVECVDEEATQFWLDSRLPKFFETKDKSKSMRMEVWQHFSSIHIGDGFQAVFMKLEINGRPSHGLLLRKTITASMSNPTLLLSKSIVESDKNKEELFVSLKSNECRNVSLVGGKGASLAHLTDLAEKVKGFKTAPGFCATTALFKHVIKKQQLQDIFTNYESLPTACDKASKLIQTLDIVNTIKLLLPNQLNNDFGAKRSSGLRFAVRSSGVLEDGSDLSCAGQNETFLGVSEEMIPEKIAACWASLFTVQSVSYRINHGQQIVTEMGVVIQEMIDAAVAGIMFTANPQTGNPFELLITANYGLGESVVSGSCDPDTIIIRKTRSKEALDSCHKKLLSIGEVTVGSKQSKTVLILDGNSVIEEPVDDDESRKLCLKDEAMLDLSLIGCEIKKISGNLKHLDIEWAVEKDGSIVILQSRSMTSLDVWNDFEIMHQFDTAIRAPNERLTRANTGEVMPKPLHPVAVQTISKNLDACVQRRTSENNGNPVCAVCPRSCIMFCNRMFLSVYPTLYKRIDAEIDTAVCCVDLTVFGRPVITKEVHAIAVERYGIQSGSAKLSGLWNTIKAMRSVKTKVEKAVVDYSSWTFPIRKDELLTPTIVYDRITKSLIPLHEVIEYHCLTSECSSATLVFAFLALAGGKKAEEWPPSLYEDAGKLLSAYSMVESAEMPVDIDELAEAILQHGGNVEKFVSSTSTEAALSWLRSNDAVSKAFDKFMTKHGHRSICELDVGQDSWRVDPSPLLQSLRKVVSNKGKNSNNKNSISANNIDDDNLLDKITTPLTPNAKRFLKFILPHCRRMVIYREKTKSLLVRVISELNTGYNLLAELMIKEHLLPEKKRIKYLTHDEIRLILERNPSTPSLLYRASKRLRLRPSMDEMEYPEITTGVPKPQIYNPETNAEKTVKGTPVSAGRVKGIVKVCLNVDQASATLEQGDILVTRGTDIAWSPFFPMLGGVVTELGGLISHGAVVAREYGLPCIVGAENATRIFKSGDEVILDTSNGTIAKVI